MSSFDTTSQQHTARTLQKVRWRNFSTASALDLWRAILVVWDKTICPYMWAKPSKNIPGNPFRWMSLPCSPVWQCCGLYICTINIVSVTLMKSFKPKDNWIGFKRSLRKMIKLLWDSVLNFNTKKKKKEPPPPPPNECRLDWLWTLLVSIPIKDKSWKMLAGFLSSVKGV